MKKTCSKCGTEKPVEEFPRSSTGAAGRHSQCSECRKIAKKAWVERNRDRVRAYAATYYETAQKSHNAARYAKDREKFRAWRKAYYTKHHEQELTRARAWKDVKREYLRQFDRDRYHKDRPAMLAKNKRWYARNPEKRAELGARKRARAAGCEIHKVDYAAIIARDNYVCHICEQHIERKDLSFDHVIPLSRGGPHSNDNVRIAHRICNLRKGNRI